LPRQRAPQRILLAPSQRRMSRLWCLFFFSSRRRHTRLQGDWSSDVCSSDLAEVVAMTRWVESRLPVLAIDEPERLVSFGKRSVFELAPGDPYYLEGALEALDEPGEWCLDPAAAKVFYLPRPGEKLDQIEAIAPVLIQV